MTRRSFLAAAVTSTLHGAPPHCGMGLVIHSFNVRRMPKALQFLEYAHSLGAGGIQTLLNVDSPGELRTLREKAGEWNMFLEGMCRLPKTDDTSDLERLILQAKEAGASCLRTVCLLGRRYETFETLEGWKEFVANSKAAIARSVPLFEKHKVTLAVENHKDWTTEEHLALMKEYESEYLGVTLDTGNNIALLDEPMKVVEALAPYAASTHLKDMGVEEYEEGLLTTEVPFGEGILDMVRVAEVIRKARPKTKMALEMITRNPLQIPCLTDKYWVTFPNRNGRYLARALSMVRAHKGNGPLPRPGDLDKAARMRVEEDNVKRCLHFARERMGLS